MWYYSYFPTEPNAELPMYLYSIGMHDTQPLLEMCIRDSDNTISKVMTIIKIIKSFFCISVVNLMLLRLLTAMTSP